MRVWQVRLCSVVCPTGNGVGGVRMTAGSCEEGHGDHTAKRKKETTDNQSSTIIVEKCSLKDDNLQCWGRPNAVPKPGLAQKLGTSIFSSGKYLPSSLIEKCLHALERWAARQRDRTCNAQGASRAPAAWQRAPPTELLFSCDVLLSQAFCCDNAPLQPCLPRQSLAVGAAPVSSMLCSVFSIRGQEMRFLCWRADRLVVCNEITEGCLQGTLHFFFLQWIRDCAQEPALFWFRRRMIFSKAMKPAVPGLFCDIQLLISDFFLPLLVLPSLN